MLLKPMKRIWPSLRRMALSNTLRHTAGLRKGSIPSSTSINAKALSSKSGISDAALLLLDGWRGAGIPSHGPEELTRRINNDHVGLVLEGRSVRFQAAVKLGKFWIAAKGVGIQGGGLGIA